MSQVDEFFWKVEADNRFDLIVKDVFIDFTKNYMTPDDLINDTARVRWTFPASIFFSWTAITTIGNYEKYYKLLNFIKFWHIF